MAIALFDEDSAPTAPRPPQRKRMGMKDTVLDLLNEVGTTGLNSAIAVEIAEKQGTHLDRQSVSSHLSRLKAEGIAVYENQQYKLKTIRRDRNLPEAFLSGRSHGVARKGATYAPLRASETHRHCWRSFAGIWSPFPWKRYRSRDRKCKLPLAAAFAFSTCGLQAAIIGQLRLCG
jgi:hypothetical protein